MLEGVHVTWRSALSLLAGHDAALKTRLVRVHFGSDSVRTGISGIPAAFVLSQAI